MEHILSRHRTVLLPALLLCLTFAGADQRANVEYFRDETAFKRGISLFPFEVHDAGYLLVTYDAQRFVRALQWYSQADSLTKTRTYEYWPGDKSLRYMVEFTPDSLIIREIRFGDEPKSEEWIRYVYEVDTVKDFRNRFTEIIYDSAQVISTYKIMSAKGELLGAIFMDYDSLGYMINETWFQGARMQRVREFRYIFDRATGVQEVIERGRGGQVVSHVRLKTELHNIPADGINADAGHIIQQETAGDTTAAQP